MEGEHQLQLLALEIQKKGKKAKSKGKQQKAKRQGAPSLKLWNSIGPTCQLQLMYLTVSDVRLADKSVQARTQASLRAGHAAPQL